MNKMRAANLAVVYDIRFPQSSVSVSPLQSRWHTMRRYWLLIPIAMLGVAALTAPRLPAASIVKQELQWLNRQAASGDSVAQRQLGVAYMDGQYGLKPDAQEGLYWLQAAARGGESYAKTAVGDAHAAGLDGLKDPDRTLEWWQRVMVAGDTAARERLHQPLHVGALATFWNDLMQSLPLRRSPRILMDRAASGDAEAQYQLAMRYRDGAWGVERDAGQALTWLQQAAKGGDDVAMATLATVYETGDLGATPDGEKATYWHRQAAGKF